MGSASDAHDTSISGWSSVTITGCSLTAVTLFSAAVKGGHIISQDPIPAAHTEEGCTDTAPLGPADGARTGGKQILTETDAKATTIGLSAHQHPTSVL